eukprot:Platyproteum_vivax@DN5482_c0_g1_i3.p1
MSTLPSSWDLISSEFRSYLMIQGIMREQFDLLDPVTKAKLFENFRQLPTVNSNVGQSFGDKTPTALSTNSLGVHTNSVSYPSQVNQSLTQGGKISNSYQSAYLSGAPTVRYTSTPYTSASLSNGALTNGYSTNLTNGYSTNLKTSTLTTNNYIRSPTTTATSPTKLETYTYTSPSLQSAYPVKTTVTPATFVLPTQYATTSLRTLPYMTQPLVTQPVLAQPQVLQTVQKTPNYGGVRVPPVVIRSDAPLQPVPVPRSLTPPPLPEPTPPIYPATPPMPPPMMPPMPPPQYGLSNADQLTHTKFYHELPVCGCGAPFVLAMAEAVGGCGCDSCGQEKYGQQLVLLCSQGHNEFHSGGWAYCRECYMAGKSVVQCVCKRPMTRMSADAAARSYNPSSTDVRCNMCRRYFVGGGMWHCKAMYIAVHPAGYDVCDDCAHKPAGQPIDNRSMPYPEEITQPTKSIPPTPAVPEKPAQPVPAPKKPPTETAKKRTCAC